MTTSRDVLWYIPNQIGYGRVIAALLSFVTMSSHPMWTAWLYGISCTLDALDGTMARKYNQSSRVGAVLDMVTDRSTTAGLICYLCIKYANNMSAIVFLQTMLALDISSHYMHMYASITNGATSHKSMDKENSNFLLRLYYTRRDVLFVVCAMHEVFYSGMYLWALEEYAYSGRLLCIICLPGFIFKQVTNVIQLCRAAIILAEMDAKDAKAAASKDKN